MRQHRDILFPPPTRGWVQSGNITSAGLDQAEVLDNFFPTAQTARLRGGSTVYADVEDAVRRFLVHSSSVDELFAATDEGIFDCARIALGGDAFADVAGFTSGDWSATQLANSGGQFLVAVNGSDAMQVYDGADWYPVVADAQNDLAYDGLTAAFTIGETLTGGTSGATAEIVGISQASATTGTLRLGPITGGPFQDNEAITSAGGAAVANGASASGSAIALTGVATSDLSQIWLFKERLFAVEGGTLSAWYGAVETIGGAWTELPLGAVFRRGGVLVFGATWSLDSGSGIDDVCIFVTSNGEIAVYEGIDPSDSNSWSLSGVYEIGQPLNKHAFFKAGGDLAILTRDGIIPVSEALRKDRAALQAVALTALIEDAWKKAVAGSTVDFPVSPTLWQSQSLLMIGVPGEDSIAYVANARTGAWCRYTGWDVRCGAVADDTLYFGTSDGRVMIGQSGGSDDGVSYTGVYVPKFTDARSPQQKVVNTGVLTFKSNGSPNFAMGAFSNYQVGNAKVPLPTETDDSSSWGVGLWGSFVWGEGASSRTYTRLKSIYAVGVSVAPAIYVTSLQTTKPVFEILSTTIRFETGTPF